ncbi:MAG: hypothetical protein Ta2A_00170 [Treponemataceae bacterium]|nr:MAG: hypothetical protein Ta2A_00170 [Treponemataceae bacterium]
MGIYRRALCMCYDSIAMCESTMRIIEAIKAIPYGTVSSYRAVAWAAGIQNGARQVARTLHSMSESQHAA